MVVCEMVVGMTGTLKNRQYNWVNVPIYSFLLERSGPLKQISLEPQRLDHFLYCVLKSDCYKMFVRSTEGKPILILRLRFPQISYFGP